MPGRNGLRRPSRPHNLSKQHKKVLEAARKLSKPYRITDGKGFRLRDADTDDAGDFKSKDKTLAKEALQVGVEALTGLQDRL